MSLAAERTRGRSRQISGVALARRASEERRTLYIRCVSSASTSRSSSSSATSVSSPAALAEPLVRVDTTTFNILDPRLTDEEIVDDDEQDSPALLRMRLEERERLLCLQKAKSKQTWEQTVERKWQESVGLYMRPLSPPRPVSTKREKISYTTTLKPTQPKPHAASTSVPFKDVLTAMRGPLFPPEPDSDTASQSDQDSDLDQNPIASFSFNLSSSPLTSRPLARESNKRRRRQSLTPPTMSMSSVDDWTRTHAKSLSCSKPKPPKTRKQRREKELLNILLSPLLNDDVQTNVLPKSEAKKVMSTPQEWICDSCRRKRSIKQDSLKSPNGIKRSWSWLTTSSTSSLSASVSSASTLFSATSPASSAPTTPSTSPLPSSGKRASINLTWFSTTTKPPDQVERPWCHCPTTTSPSQHNLRRWPNVNDTEWPIRFSSPSPASSDSSNSPSSSPDTTISAFVIPATPHTYPLPNLTLGISKLIQLTKGFQKFQETVQGVYVAQAGFVDASPTIVLEERRVERTGADRQRKRERLNAPGYRALIGDVRTCFSASITRVENDEELGKPLVDIPKSPSKSSQKQTRKSIAKARLSSCPPPLSHSAFSHSDSDTEMEPPPAYSYSYSFSYAHSPPRTLLPSKLPYNLVFKRDIGPATSPWKRMAEIALSAGVGGDARVNTDEKTGLFDTSTIPTPPAGRTLRSSRSMPNSLSLSLSISPPIWAVDHSSVLRVRRERERERDNRAVYGRGRDWIPMIMPRQSQTGATRRVVTPPIPTPPTTPAPAVVAPAAPIPRPRTVPNPNYLRSKALYNTLPLPKKHKSKSKSRRAMTSPHLRWSSERCPCGPFELDVSPGTDIDIGMGMDIVLRVDSSPESQREAGTLRPIPAVPAEIPIPKLEIVMEKKEKSVSERCASVAWERRGGSALRVEVC